ncbi:MAG: YheT family hydrolase [Candidatus Cyclobacteriaceae bacterium M3_2C_046]
MPHISNSKYRAPFYLFNQHMETIIPNLFRKVGPVNYQRQKYQTRDQDFFYLDWIKNNSDKLVILAHGLEGSSTKGYMRGMAKMFSEQGSDVLAWNCRSCGGEMNLKEKLYHHGDIDDLKELMEFILSKYNYKKIFLIGFSMGGSIIIKLLASYAQSMPHQLKGGIAISVPCHLSSSAVEVEKKKNRIYHQRFLKKLRRKIEQKFRHQPDFFQQIKKARSFSDLNRLYTVKIYGYQNEQEFYQQASAGNYLTQLTVPTYILNALNDPMLSNQCYPVQIAQKHSKVFLETPSRGGHVGFSQENSPYTWSETRSLDFVRQFAS